MPVTNMTTTSECRTGTAARPSRGERVAHSRRGHRAAWRPAVTSSAAADARRRITGAGGRRATKSIIPRGHIERRTAWGTAIPCERAQRGDTLAPRRQNADSAADLDSQPPYLKPRRIGGVRACVLGLLASLTLAGCERYATARRPTDPGDTATALIEDPIDRRPSLWNIALEGDTAWFGRFGFPDANPDAMFAYSRATGEWTRRPAARRQPAWPTRIMLGAYPESIPIARGFWLVVMEDADGVRTHAIRDPRQRAISLRRPRIAAQRSWIRHHPPPPNDRDWPPPDGPPQWGRVEVQRLVVDGNVAWLGLRGAGSEPYDVVSARELGGLMRLDLLRGTVSVVAADEVMPRSIATMAAAGGSLWIAAPDTADATRVLRYDTAANRWSSESFTQLGRILDLNGEGPSLFISAANGLARYDTRTSQVDARYFRLTIAAGGTAGDTLVYDLAEAPIARDWNELGIAAVIHAFGIRRAAAFHRLARGHVRVAAVRFWNEGERLESSWVIGDSAYKPLSEDELEEHATGLEVAGLARVELAPFYAEALAVPPLVIGQVATILADIGDPRWTPALRAALGTPPQHVLHELQLEDVALALDRLGDPRGVQWVLGRVAEHRARREPISSLFYDRLKTVTNGLLTDSLMALLVADDTLYSGEAIRVLVHSTEPQVLLRLATAVRDGSPRMRRWLVWNFGHRIHNGSWAPTVSDSIPYADPAFHRAIAAAARPVLADTNHWMAASAAEFIAAFGSLDDVAALCPFMEDARGNVRDAAILAMIRITGDGMQWPPSRDTPADARAGARRWCEAWVGNPVKPLPPPRATRDSLYASWNWQRHR
jgi:hypothetical protein